MFMYYFSSISYSHLIVYKKNNHFNLFFIQDNIYLKLINFEKCCATSLREYIFSSNSIFFKKSYCKTSGRKYFLLFCNLMCQIFLEKRKKCSS